jgi:hypothetical protein
MMNELKINGHTGALTWTLNKDTLTISGAGVMPDYNPSTTAPWDSCRNTIVTVIIENGVANIGAGAFFACGNLTSVTIPDSVTKIGTSAFGMCHRLTSLTIPDGVSIIGFFAFAHCTGLASITIPDSVRRIENNAFADCSGLTSVTISDSVSNIERWTFHNCTNLKNLFLLSENPPAMSHNPFEKMKDTCVLHIFVGCKDKYTQAEWWKDFKSIQEDLKY